MSILSTIFLFIIHIREHNIINNQHYYYLEFEKSIECKRIFYKVDLYYKQVMLFKILII